MNWLAEANVLLLCSGGFPGFNLRYPGVFRPARGSANAASYSDLGGTTGASRIGGWPAGLGAGPWTGSREESTGRGVGDGRRRGGGAFGDGCAFESAAFAPCLLCRRLAGGEPASAAGAGGAGFGMDFGVGFGAASAGGDSGRDEAPTCGSSPPPSTPRCPFALRAGVSTAATTARRGGGGRGRGVGG